jgi:DNA repair exonuclease SbcCD ATPase subunit
MRVERLDIRGYRRLRGSYEFAAGLTLVVGPNEAGKSTLHDAVVRSLFGFSPEERRRREGSSPKDERMPWTGGPFGLTLRSHDREEQVVLVRWDFSSDLVELQDAVTGESLLREQPKQRADYELGRRLVGMTREEFIQVCCLYQEALDTVRPSEGLHAALQRSVESAPAEDIGVQSADHRLGKGLSGLGVHGGHYGELPNGELQRLLTREDALQNELAAAREQRAELDRVAARLDEARKCRAQVGERATVLQQASLRATVERLEQRWKRARGLIGERDDRPVTEPTLQRELVGREQELRNQMAKLDAREHWLMSEVDTRSDEVAEQERALTGAQERVEALRGYAQVSPAGEEKVRALLAGIRASTEETPEGKPAAAPEGDPIVARFHDQRDELIALRAAATGRQWNNRLLAVALVLGVIGATGAAVVNPTLAVLLLAAAACAWVARPRGSPAEFDSLASFDGRSFEQLDQARLEEERSLSSFHAAREAREHTRAKERERRDELRRMLEAAIRAYEGDETSGNLIQRGEAYLSRCDGSRKLAEAAGEQQHIGGRLNELRSPVGRLEELREERKGPEGELLDLYRQASLDTDDLAGAAVAFAERAKSTQRDEARTKRSDEASAALGELLDGGTEEELLCEVETARGRLDEHEQAHGQFTLDGPAVDPASPEPVGAGIDEELKQKDIEIAELQTVVEQREASLSDPADLEVEIAQVHARREQAELTRDAIHIARDALRKAAQDAHRRVAPRLNEALRRELPRITRGRYKEGTVDEDLAIKLYVPESGKLVSIEQLSRGTRDQVALVQRLEIARLLDPTAGHAPLLLDDPFAHFDAERLRLGAELIAEVAERRQVILFTESIEVMKMMQEVSSSCSLIELPDPVDQVVDTLDAHHAST